MTDLTDSLNETEKNLLAKGPKFALAQRVDEFTLAHVNVSFYRLANLLRWQTVRCDSNHSQDYIKYPQSRNIYKPETSDEFETKLQRMHAEYQLAIRKIKPRGKWTNLTKPEKETLRSLKRKGLVCLPSDKGSEFCILDIQTYTEAALNHLNDSTTYKRVPRMSAKTIEKKVNAVWKDICMTNLIPRHIEKSFISSNTDLPRFYHLIKTHKQAETLKIRPIVSNVHGPTKRISWFMAHLLQPLLANIPAHLESSLQLIQRIQTNNSDANWEFPYPFSLDVVALYTSIPINEAIENISNIMGQSINRSITSQEMI